MNKTELIQRVIEKMTKQQSENIIAMFLDEESEEQLRMRLAQLEHRI